jgi:hypothetical protein
MCVSNEGRYMLQASGLGTDTRLSFLVTLSLAIQGERQVDRDTKERSLEYGYSSFGRVRSMKYTIDGYLDKRQDFQLFLDRIAREMKLTMRTVNSRDEGNSFTRAEVGSVHVFASMDANPFNEVRSFFIENNDRAMMDRQDRLSGIRAEIPRANEEYSSPLGAV